MQEITHASLLNTKYQQKKKRNDHLRLLIIEYNYVFSTGYSSSLELEKKYFSYPSLRFLRIAKKFPKKCFDVEGSLGEGNLNRDKPFHSQNRTMSLLKIGLWDKN